MAGIWLMLAAAFMATAWIVESLTVMVVALVGALCSLLIGLASLFAPEKVGAGAGVPARPVRTGWARGSGSRGRSGARAGTARPARPAKPRKCSARCRQSTKPVDSCRCSCCGRTHGSEAPGGPKQTKPKQPAGPPRLSPNDDGSRRWLRSAEAKRLEKQVARAERRDRGA